MDENDMLYQQFQKAQENRSKQKFNYFINSLKNVIVTDLDKYYIQDKEKYQTYLSNVKNVFGYKVFRNSEGKHKVIITFA